MAATTALPAPETTSAAECEDLRPREDEFLFEVAKDFRSEQEAQIAVAATKCYCHCHCERPN